MKLNLQRLEELKRELHPDGVPDYENQEPLGLQIIMESVRNYVYDNSNEVVTKLLKDYGVLVDEVEDGNPIVKPHKFNING